METQGFTFITAEIDRSTLHTVRKALEEKSDLNQFEAEIKELVSDLITGDEEYSG